jgi:DNA polymerase III delta prime subunit
MLPSNEINKLLCRDAIYDQIRDILRSFNTHKDSPTYKKGIYIYGAPGCGKTTFVMQTLKDMNYDILQYDAGDVRNKSLIDSITNNAISTNNVIDLMRGIVKHKVIVMDEIDGMNNGDKGGITSLIKLIRPKKTKKQKNEIKTGFPVICIGNYYSDKKIRELMKVCHVFELKRPTNEQITNLFRLRQGSDTVVTEEVIEFVQGDMRKMEFVVELQRAGAPVSVILNTVFQKKLFNEDVKQITRKLLHHPARLCDHDSRMNETDRTIIALLWHENIVDYLYPDVGDATKDFYLRLLDNIRYADYIDRITFQYQIWQFNEMSSLIKTFHCNQMYHEYHAKYGQNRPLPAVDNEIRFTKVLTKYSTEYNNQVFIQNMCYELNMDKKDVVAMFEELRNTDMTAVEKELKSCNISKLDIRRMYKYLDKSVKKDENAEMEEDEEDDIDVDEGDYVT